MVRATTGFSQDLGVALLSLNAFALTYHHLLQSHATSLLSKEASTKLSSVAHCKGDSAGVADWHHRQLAQNVIKGST
jgi:hypothetical protein